MRVTRIRVQCFRCLDDVDVALRPFTVIVGPNGAGKSTFLEAMGLLSGKRNLVQAISKLGGFSAAVSFHTLFGPSIDFQIHACDEKCDYVYAITLSGEQGGFFVEKEAFGTNKDPSRNWRKDTQAGFIQRDGTQQFTGIGHGPDPFLPGQCRQNNQSVAFWSALKRIEICRVHEFQLNEKTRGPQQLQPTKFPSSDGTDLFSALYSLRTERRSAFNELLETMKSAIPELEEIEFPLAGAGHVNMTWRLSKHPRELYSNQLSDGTLRLLWLMTILHAAPDDATVLIDEPELSLHPQWILLVVSVMRKMSARMNVVVATQSTEFIRWVERDELLIADMTDEGAKFHWASEKPNIDEWLKDFTLDQLWTMGELGGRR